MFITKLKVEYVPTTKPKEYCLKDRLAFADGEFIYKAPKNFITDFASVPRWLHWWVSPRGKHSRASVLHDYLYSLKHFSRYKADMIFLKAMKEDGVKKRYRIPMFLGVFIFGAFFKRGRKI